MPKCTRTFRIFILININSEVRNYILIIKTEFRSHLFSDPILRGSTGEFFEKNKS